MEGLSEAYLLRRILAWYADPGNWNGLSRGPSGPYSISGRNPTALADCGRNAAHAVEAVGIGALLRVTCDVDDIAVTDLSRRSGVSMARLTELVQGSAPTADESMNLRRAMEGAMEARR